MLLNLNEQCNFLFLFGNKVSYFFQDVSNFLHEWKSLDILISVVEQTTAPRLTVSFFTPTVRVQLKAFDVCFYPLIVYFYFLNYAFVCAFDECFYPLIINLYFLNYAFVCVYLMYAFTHWQSISIFLTMLLCICILCMLLSFNW